MWKRFALHKRSQGWQGARPPIEMLPMIKISQKRLCFFSLSFFQHLRVQQYTRTKVINKNIDRGGPGSFNLIFANQFTMGPLQ